MASQDKQLMVDEAELNKILWQTGRYDVKPGRAVETEPQDMGVSPQHYMVLPVKDVEAMDIIKELLGEEGYKAYCRGNILKYILRRKGNVAQDIEKIVVRGSFSNPRLVRVFLLVRIRPPASKNSRRSGFKENR